MNRTKYILAAGLLISLIGLAAGQGIIDEANETPLLEENDTDITIENDTNNTTENETNVTDHEENLNETDNETENQTDNQTVDNQTGNETENQTGNETDNETENQTGGGAVAPTGNITGETENETGNQTEQEENVTTVEDIDESVETVILASNENYPDALVSGAVAESYGIPVLLTDSENLSNPTSRVIENAEVENVIMVGGPSVISEEVEEEVEDEVDTTTRLWGITQVGTSNEIANYFYDESDEATVINYEPYQDNDSYQLLAAVKEHAAQEDEPLLVTSGENLSNSTEEALDSLEVEEVDLYTTRDGNTEDQLEEMDINVNAQEGDIDEHIEQIRENITEDDLNESAHFFAAENYSDAISAPSYPEGPSIGIYSEENISDSTEFLNDTEISEVDITGNEDLADQTANEIQEQQNEIEIRTIIGSPARVAAQLVATNIDIWNQTQEQNLDEFEQTIQEQELENELEDLQDETRQPATEEENETENETEEVQNALDDAEEALDENNLIVAKARLAEARSELNKSEFNQLSQEEIDERVNEELSITTATEQDQANQTESENETNETAEGVTEDQNETENESEAENESNESGLAEELNLTDQ